MVSWAGGRGEAEAYGTSGVFGKSHILHTKML